MKLKYLLKWCQYGYYSRDHSLNFLKLLNVLPIRFTLSVQEVFLTSFAPSKKMHSCEFNAFVLISAETHRHLYSMVNYVFLSSLH